MLKTQTWQVTQAENGYAVRTNSGDTVLIQTQDGDLDKSRQYAELLASAPNGASLLANLFTNDPIAGMIAKEDPAAHQQFKDWENHIREVDPSDLFGFQGGNTTGRTGGQQGGGYR